MKRGTKRNYNPWERSPDFTYEHQYSEDDNYYFEHLVKKRPKFTQNPANDHLDIDTKRAALMASPSVVALVFFSGEKELSQGCGTIIEIDHDNWVTVLSSANLVRCPTDENVAENLLANNIKINVHVSDGDPFKGEIVAYDFHYNIMAIRFQSPSPLPAAKWRHVNDSISLSKEKPFQLRHHSSSLVPGDTVIAIGRYFAKPFGLMAAPGCFSLDRCEHDCKELFMVTCDITRCGDGGPLINLSGEVIGITFYELGSFSFVLPMNIAYKWWNNYNSCGEPRHPFLGFEATNFYAADLDIMERIMRRFPSICQGVIVEKVKLGSCAHSAGLRQDDVIIQCGGKTVDSFLQLWEIMWDMVGETVELIVARADHDALVHLDMMVGQVTPDEFNSWPRWERW